MKEYLIDTTGYVLRYHDLPGEGIPILFFTGLVVQVHSIIRK